MKAFFSIIFVLLLVATFLAYLYLTDASDLIIVKSLPSYPNSTTITTNSYSGLPDTQRSAIVTFKTEDNGETITKFYMDNLPKTGWQVKSYQIEKNSEGLISGYLLIFNKSYFGLSYEARIVNYISNKRSANPTDYKDVLVSVQQRGGT